MITRSTMNFLPAFIITCLLSFVVASPVEWLVHRYLMHAPPHKRKMPITKRASHSHHDMHHGAFSQPSHYYFDLTNEHAGVHFSTWDVTIIALCSLGLSGAIGALFHVITATAWTWGTAGFMAGFLAAIMIYYAAYETTHHYMHVIGERRMNINKYFGNLLQKKADGKLRFSKPILDTLCTTIENNVDKAARTTKPMYEYGHELMGSLQAQFALNIDTADIGKKQLEAILTTLTNSIASLEAKKRKQLNAWGTFTYRLERHTQRWLRNSALFQYVDNHHFLHHYAYYKNLNVVWPLADKLLQTKSDSSKSVLDNPSNRAFWLCPNSPDTAKFVFGWTPA